MDHDRFIEHNRELIDKRILAEVPEAVITDYARAAWVRNDAYLHKLASKAPTPINYDLLRARLLLLTAGLKEE